MKPTRSLISIISVVCAIAIGVWLVGLLFAGSRENFDEVALKGVAESIFGRIDGDPVHCTTNVDECLVPALGRNFPKRIIWIGNSQLHAINQPSSSAETAAALLAQRLRQRQIEVLSFSQPNASLQEHRLLVEYFLHRFQPDKLIVPLVFDDTREDSIRLGLRALYDRKDVAAGLEGSGVGERLKDLHVKDPGPVAFSLQTPGALQKHVENSVDEFLLEHSVVWRSRSQAKGTIALDLFLLRNSIFGITPTSKRRLIPAAYRRNMEALEGILARARQEGVQVITYIVPIRTDVEPPYIETEYERFRTESEALSNKYDATFLDLENLVPGPLWGTKAATTIGGEQELDFMHFREEGHVLLEEAIAAELGVSE